MNTRYDVNELRDFAQTVLAAVGLPAEPAEAVARGLVKADLYGHTTHGLALLPDYADEIANGSMTCGGKPDVLSDFGAVALWDARRLPGLWTTDLAVAEATGRAGRFGLGRGVGGRAGVGCRTGACGRRSGWSGARRSSRWRSCHRRT